MGLPADDLKRLSTLLDEAQDIDPAQRERWLQGLQGDSARLSPVLRDLLQRQAAQETDELLDRGPAFAPPAAGPATGDAVGPYRLIRQLGSGGMGAVWLAERADGSLKRQVALKLPHQGWAPGLAERFAREREILSSLEHPHIARLYDAGLDAQGRPFMALEYVEGQAIDVYCRRHAESVPGKLRLLLQVADAVAFAHSRLVVHRDLKPGNILVTDDGQVRLLDFGIAKLMQGDSAAETTLTRAAGRALTLDYASPEQIRGEAIGTASDVYSLGVVAFELLSGVRPYKLKRGTVAELEEAIASTEAPLASQLTDDAALRQALRGDLDAILNKALKKSVAERFPTVDALAQDWRRHLQGVRVLARPDTWGLRAVRLLRRHRWPLAAVGAAVAVFGLSFGAGATAVVMAALLAGMGLALWQARTARDQARLARTEARTAQAVQDFLIDLFQATSVQQKDPVKAQQTTARELLAIGALRIGSSLADAPESRIRMLQLLGDMHWQLGLREEASRLKLQAVDQARRTFGALDARFARVAVDCAGALTQSAHRGQTPALLQEADAAMVASGLGHSHDRALLLLQLAMHVRDESLVPALQAAEQAVTVMASLDAAHVDLVSTYRAAGRARLIAGDMGLAEQHYRAALRVAEQQGDARGTWLVNCCAELAEALFKLGRFAQAEVQGRAALQHSLQVHGEMHRWTLIVRVRLANQLMRTGACAEAESHFAALQQQLAEDRAEFDEQFRADMAGYLGLTWPERGRPDLAEPLILADLADLQTWSPNSYGVAIRQAELAALWIDLGRSQEASELAEQAWQLWRHYAGERASSVSNRYFAAVAARLWRVRGQAEQGREVLEAHPGPAEAESGRWHQTNLEAQIERVEIELAAGQPALARSLAQSELDALRQRCGAVSLPHPMARLLGLRAQAALALGDRAAAAADIQQAEALRLPHDDPDSRWLQQLSQLRRDHAL